MLVALALLGLVPASAPAQAPAPIITVEGFFDHVTTRDRNVSFDDADVGQTRDAEWYARTRGRLQITGEIGRSKAVFLFEHDVSWGTVSGGAFGVSPEGELRDRDGRVGTTQGGNLDTSLLGTSEMIWMYTEFPFSGPGSLLLALPPPGMLRLGFQPFEETYKPGLLATGAFGGAHAEIDLLPAITLTGTYAQYEEAGTGRLFGSGRGDDFAAIVGLEVRPLRDTAIKGLYSYLLIDGDVAPGPREGRGGVVNSSDFFPSGATENRHTVGVDAVWTSGAWSLGPSLFYQWGTREMIPTVPSARRRPACGGRCVEQEMSAWLVDVRGGWQRGDLLLEGLAMYTTGNRAEQDVRSGRPIHFYQLVDTRASYATGWGHITAVGIDSFTLLNGRVQGIRPATALGYDKYGRIQTGLRAAYALTDAFRLRGLVTSLWTAEPVDTRGRILSDGCFQDVPGCAGLTPRNSGPASRASDRYLGTELDVGFDWQFAPNITFLWTYAHLFAGGALRHARADGLPGRVRDADSTTAVVRYTF